MMTYELDDIELEVLLNLQARGLSVLPDGKAVIVIGPREKIPVDRPTDAHDLTSPTRARRFESLKSAKSILLGDNDEQVQPPNQ